MAIRPQAGLSLCAGGGGLDMGLELAEPGFRTACYVEWEQYPRAVLQAGMANGYFHPAPIWSDLRTFDARPWRGVVDTVLAGYPCQPFSSAGQRKGADDERHLWPEVARVIRECQPRWVFLENVVGHVSLGADTVLRELWDMGWTPAAGLFSASETGAAHERLRWFCVAYRDDGSGLTQSQGRVTDERRRAGDGGDFMAHPNGGNPGAEREQRGGEQRLHPEGGSPLAHPYIGCGERRPGGIPGLSDEEDRKGPDDHNSGSGPNVANAGIGRRAGSIARQDQQPGRTETERAGDAVGNAERSQLPRRAGEGAIGSRRQKCGPVSRRGELADASGAERQGQQPGQHDTRGRQEPHGHTALCGGTGVHAPGPGDAAAWAAVLRVAPDLAPAVSFGDIKCIADRFAQMVAAGELAEAEAESRLCFLASSMANRSRILRLLGNGVVPIQAAYAWRMLSMAHGNSTPTGVGE